jgi:hypothetical protein
LVKYYLKAIIKNSFQKGNQMQVIEITPTYLYDITENINTAKTVEEQEQLINKLRNKVNDGFVIIKEDSNWYYIRKIIR